MEVEKSILKTPNHKTDQSFAGKTVHFKTVEMIHEKFTEEENPRSRAIPLDVYGKPEIYRWRTAYDEAYNVNNQVFFLDTQAGQMSQEDLEYYILDGKSRTYLEI